MRFTRHARQRMKLYGVSRAQAAAIARWGEQDGADARGNARRIGWVDGRRIRVIVASDDPELVVTIHFRRP